jgi:poly-beta-1,6-N-acetyl-D-glucosamine synthase
MNRIVAIIPAHNEERMIRQTLDSLTSQVRPPDHIIVAADNCTDETGPVARAAGAEVFSTQGNSARKAGALNQVLDSVLYTLDSADFVLVMDADSQLDHGFLAAAVRQLDSDPHLGGVGGSFRGGAGGGWVGTLQRNEYARYARDVRRLKGKVLVLTGTAAVFRVAALRAVIAGRAGGELPAGAGVYDTSVLTEDNELTLALLHLGYGVLSPRECTLVTEVMPTWRDLYRQRLRWKRGAVENLVQYGLTRITWRYWGRQLLTGAGCLVTVLYLGTVALSLLVAHHISVHPVWLAVTAIFALERAVTVSDRGWRHMLVGATVLAEMPFDLFLQVVHVHAYTQALLGRERRW